MVAVVALAGAALYKFATPDYKAVAYVDGRQITDKKTVKTLAENTLDNVLAADNTIEEQLGRFAEIQF